MIYYLNSLPAASGDKVVIADFDFTESLTDKVNGFTSSLNGGATRDSNGVHITAASQYLRINSLFGLLSLKLCTFELDIGNMELINSSTHNRFFMFDVSNGFIYRNNGHWNVYAGSSWKTDGETDPNIFKNSKCIIKMSRDNSFKVYKNNTLVYETTITGNISGSNNFFIGSETQSFYNNIMTGYIMIDFAGLDLTADTSEAAITKTGLFAAASAAIDTNKPIYITGAVNGLKGACTPIQAFGNKGTAITLTVSHYEISITSADAVTITDLIPAAEEPTKTTRKSSK